MKVANLLLKKLSSPFSFEFVQAKLFLSDNITLITHYNAMENDFHQYFDQLKEGFSTEKHEIIMVSGDATRLHFVISNIPVSNTKDNITREII